MLNDTCHIAVRLFGLLASVLITSSAFGQGLMPKLITEDRLRSCLRHINLSEEQLAVIFRMNADYQEKWNSEFAQDISAYNAKWNSTYVRPDKFAGQSMEQTFREILVAQQQLRFRLMAANDLFFDDVEAILADEQLPRMQRVRLAYERLTYRRSRRPPREVHIDIVNLADELAISDEERAKVESILVDFEPVFVAALREAAEADQRAAVFEFAILDLEREPNGPQSDAALKVSELMAKGEKVRLRTARRLVEATRSLLGRLAAALTPSSAIELQRRFDEAAYPEIYPDPSNAMSLFDEVLGLEDLREDQRNFLTDARSQYVRDHENLSRRLCKMLYDNSYIYFSLHEDSDSKSADNMQRIAAVAIERERLNLSQPKKIRSVLLAEQSEKLPTWRYESQKPPRPWATVAGLAREKAERDDDQRRRDLASVLKTWMNTTNPGRAIAKPTGCQLQQTKQVVLRACPLAVSFPA